MKTVVAFVLILLWAAPASATFSIVAFDPVTGDLGVAVASRVFGVGNHVPWAEAGIGAVATQAAMNGGYGPRGLELGAAQRRASHPPGFHRVSHR